MITLPKTMTATKYPGYFWDIEEQQLYSIKIGGELRPLFLHQPNRFNRLQGSAYKVSVKGVRKLLIEEDLKLLTLQDSEIKKGNFRGLYTN